MDLELSSPHVVRDTFRDVVPDIVDGYVFGTSIGIGIRAVEGWWILKSTSFEPLAVSDFRMETVAKSDVCQGPHAKPDGRYSHSSITNEDTQPQYHSRTPLQRNEITIQIALHSA